MNLEFRYAEVSGGVSVARRTLATEKLRVANCTQVCLRNAHAENFVETRKVLAKREIARSELAIVYKAKTDSIGEEGAYLDCWCKDYPTLAAKERYMRGNKKLSGESNSLIWRSIILIWKSGKKISSWGPWLEIVVNPLRSRGFC